MPVIGLCMGLLAGVWTYEDARKRGMTSSSAGVWALGVCALLILFLPLYLAGRPPLPAGAPAPLQLAQQLLQLEEMKARGTLSEEEFLAAKARLLGNVTRAEVDEGAALINSLLQQNRKVEALAASLQLQNKLAGQPAYSEDLLNIQAAISALGGPTQSAPMSWARFLGGVVLFFGALLVVAALNMEVSVAYDGGRVNNIGLMNDRQNLLLLGSALGIGGLLMALLGGGRK